MQFLSILASAVCALDRNSSYDSCGVPGLQQNNESFGSSMDGVGDDSINLSHFITVGTFVLLALYAYLRRINSMASKYEVVPGFPSCPGPHWMTGHVTMLRGIAGAKQSEPTSFVQGYKKIFFDHADPDTGMLSLWFFSVRAVAVVRGADAKKVLLSSSYRKQAWMLRNHTSHFLGSNSILVLMNKEWRHYRNAIHKSFTSEVIRQARPKIQRVANTLVHTLLSEVKKREEEHRSSSTKSHCNLSVNGDESISDDEEIENDWSGRKTIRPSSPPLECDNATGLVLPVLKLMKMATMDTFGLIALGSDFGCTRNLKMSPVASAFDHLTTEFTRRLETPCNPLLCFYGIPTKANREYHRKQKVIRDFIAEKIEATRKQMKSKRDKDNGVSRCSDNDLLINLINAADFENKDLPGKSLDETLGDVLMTLIFGGYDTTSITLSYALYLLAKNPLKRAKCQEEVDAIFGKSDRHNQTGASKDPLFPGVEDLPYTKAVVLESLRLFPSAPSTMRTMEKPTTIGDCNGGKGVTLSEGQYVMIPIWAIQRSEMNYPRPDDMIPERWVRRKRKRSLVRIDSEDPSIPSPSIWEERPSKVEATETKNQDSGHLGNLSDDWEDDFIEPANRDAFCAFAAGARNCVGKKLAMEESVLLLATLIHNLSFELVSKDYEVNPSMHAILQKPEDNIPMIIRPRNVS